MLEARRRARRQRVAGVARHLRGRAAAVDQRNCQRSLENAINHFAIGAELGISPDNPPEQNLQLLRRMWSERPEDAAHRSTVLRAMRAQSMEFSELNVEYGYAYDSPAIVPDGTAAADAGR